MTRILIACILLVLTFEPGTAQNLSQQVKNIPYFSEKKKIPVIPPKGKRMRVIIASDAATEIDDIWAISMALQYPDRFAIEGFVGGNFDYGMVGEYGPESIKRSVEEIRTILNKAGMEGKYPVYAGSQPMQYHSTASRSEGVDFIIQRAMAGTEDDPLWIIGLGSATDIASAYLQEPAISDKIVVFWHGRTQWPFKAYNYNVYGDIHAARVLFHAPFQMVLFDTGSHLSSSLADSEKYVKPYGALGKYLYEYRFKNSQWESPSRGFFDMGDFAALIDPDIAKWEESWCPTVEQNLDYNFLKNNGRLLRCYDVDKEKTYQFLYDGLRKNYKPSK